MREIQLITKSFRLSSAVCVMCLLALAVNAFGQTPGTGAISGMVFDPSNRVIANAEVLTVNEAINMSRSAITTAEGVFRVPLLPPGNYTVTVKAMGFSEHTSHSILVTVSETSYLNVTLTIAGVNTSVQVASDTEIAEVESSTLGRAVKQEAIQSLPLASRNYTQILGLSPGVVVALPDATELGSGTQNVTSNGAKTTSNNIQFNGIDANNLSQNSARNDGEEVGTAIPAPDAIQEFKVQTANYDASYGRGAGANVDLVSRSGTNRFHGSAWEFLRNDIFNANDFFLKLDGQPCPKLNQNQFGVSFGGPILKDRTFLFIAYQGQTEINGEAAGAKQTAILPQLASDRSAATLGAQFCPANHLNAAGYLTSAGGTQVACDGSNINPVALALLNFKMSNGQYAVPNPQVDLPTSDPTQLPVGQSTFALPASFKDNQFSVNIDQIMTKKNTLSGRFFYSRAPTNEAFTLYAADVPGWGTEELDQNSMFVLADTHVFNSNLINLVRFGYMRFNGVADVANPIHASDLGMSTPTGIAGVAPGVSINGLFTTGDAGTPSQWQNTNSFIWQDTISRTRNRHNMRFGLEVKRHEVDKDAPYSADGLLHVCRLSAGPKRGAEWQPQRREQCDRKWRKLWTFPF